MKIEFTNNIQANRKCINLKHKYMYMASLGKLYMYVFWYILLKCVKALTIVFYISIYTMYINAIVGTFYYYTNIYAKERYTGGKSQKL